MRNHLTDAKLGSAVKSGEACSEYTWKSAPQECPSEMKPSEAGIQLAKYGSVYNSNWRNGHSSMVQSISGNRCLKQAGGSVA